MHVRSIVPLLLIAAALTGCSSDGGPSGPAPIVGAIGVSAGSEGSCAVGASGGLVCWGAVPNGTSADTAPIGADALGAVAIGTPIALIAVSLSREALSGGNSGCMVGSDRLTYCWGYLFDGDIGVDLGPGIHALAGAGSASSVAIGDRSVICVTRTDKGVRCYGAFAGGGRGTDSVDVSDAGPDFSLGATGLSPAQTAFGTALGYQSGCALRTDSLVACWGTRHRGQLGGALADSVQDCSAQAPAWCQPGAAPVAGGHKYRQVSAQLDHVCATRIDGGVDCWGRKFGAPTATAENWLSGCATAADCVNTPTAVAVPGTVIRVAVGIEHACALVSTGDIYCWGENGRGQLGRPGPSSATPVKVSGGYVFATLSAGQYHTCGIESGSGAIGCWGANWAGQLGDGTTTDSDVPVAVVAAQ